MKTIDQHNKEKQKFYKSLELKLSGIICPECDNEMVYKNNCILASYPPKRTVICKECRYKTNVIV